MRNVASHNNSPTTDSSRLSDQVRRKLGPSGGREDRAFTIALVLFSARAERHSGSGLKRYPKIICSSIKNSSRNGQQNSPRKRLAGVPISIVIALCSYYCF